MKLDLSLPPLSIPTLAALLFGAFAALATASLHTVLSRFAGEAGIDEWIIIAVPALLATLFGLIAYRNAATRIRKVGQSLSRGLLVAVLTWIGFSAMATWAWCVPALYAECFQHTLMISGVLGGGQMLLAALAAATILGYVIRKRIGVASEEKE